VASRGSWSRSRRGTQQRLGFSVLGETAVIRDEMCGRYYDPQGTASSQRIPTALLDSVL